jgi:hypothetical protein
MAFLTFLKKQLYHCDADVIASCVGTVYHRIPHNRLPRIIKKTTDKRAEEPRGDH